MRILKTILVTGGSGFIGSNFIHQIFERKNFSGKIINLDALTYAGNPTNLKDIEKSFPSRYVFIHGNICDKKLLESVFKKYAVDTVVHFAAESHVDRSILTPDIFLQTNVLGTQALLNAALHFWSKDKNFAEKYLFHHISTDEVYGSLGEKGSFNEKTSYAPRSPYSASKAASDMIVRSYYHTYNLPVTISNCSNNYGPYQFPEKLIPLMILNIMQHKDLPIYGDGLQIRDWIYVADHNEAVFEILQRGRTGETYNIGAENELTNMELLKKLIFVVCKKLSLDEENVVKTIKHIRDRQGHDRRYAIDAGKIKNELGWSARYTFDIALEKTVDWYLENKEWIMSVSSGEYKNWIEKNYVSREGVK